MSDNTTGGLPMPTGASTNAPMTEEQMQADHVGELVPLEEILARAQSFDSGHLNL